MLADTRPVDVSRIAMFVALPAAVAEICSDAVGGTVGILRLESGVAAAEVVETVRPRLILACADLAPTDRRALELAASASGGGRIVWLPGDVHPVRLERLVQSVAAVELADGRPLPQPSTGADAPRRAT